MIARQLLLNVSRLQTIDHELDDLLIIGRAGVEQREGAGRSRREKLGVNRDVLPNRDDDRPSELHDLVLTGVTVAIDRRSRGTVETPDSTTCREIPARRRKLWLVTEREREIQLARDQRVVRTSVRTIEEEVRAHRKNHVRLITGKLPCDLQIRKCVVAYVGISEQTS